VANTQEDIYGPDATVQKVGRIKGAYHPKSEVFTLAASNLQNLRCRRATLCHEVLGHFGLNTFTRDKRVNDRKEGIGTEQDKADVAVLFLDYHF